MLLLASLAVGLGAAPAPRRAGPHARRAPVVRAAARADVEAELLRAIARSAPSVERLVGELVAARGVARPALSKLIEGDWLLLQTSKSDLDLRNPLGRREDGTLPGLEGAIAAFTGGQSVQTASSSPIQRAVTSAFPVVQTISLQGNNPRVLQVVETPLGRLHLNARARVDKSRPERISFIFDEGYLQMSPPASLRLPYPVPFKLLGKEAEGYLDTLYLSDRLRISRGNKGTTFILERAQAK